MTLPSGSVQTRRITYSNYIVAPTNVYEDQTYGVGLDPVLKYDPNAVVQDYRFVGPAQTALAVPTGTPSYWWSSDYGIVTPNAIPQDGDTLVSWAGRGTVASQTIAPNMTGVFGGAPAIGTIYKQDNQTLFPYVQTAMPTGTTTGNSLMSLNTGDTLQNYTVHMAVRMDILPVYMSAMNLNVDPVTIALTMFSANNRLFIGARNNGEYIYRTSPLITGSRWGIVSFVYDQTARVPVVWMNGSMLTTHSGTVTSYTASGVYPYKDLYLRGSSGFKYATMTELVIDKTAQATGVVLSWQNYLLSKYYY